MIATLKDLLAKLHHEETARRNKIARTQQELDDMAEAFSCLDFARLKIYLGPIDAVAVETDLCIERAKNGKPERPGHGRG